jgi:hypothetical protein
VGIVVTRIILIQFAGWPIAHRPMTEGAKRLTLRCNKTTEKPRQTRDRIRISETKKFEIGHDQVGKRKAAFEKIMANVSEKLVSDVDFVNDLPIRVE